jgi:hypothetical protein
MTMAVKIRKEFQEILLTAQLENCSLLKILFFEHLFCMGVEDDFFCVRHLHCISKQRTEGDRAEVRGETKKLHNNNLLILFLRSWWSS